MSFKRKADSDGSRSPTCYPVAKRLLSQRQPMRDELAAFEAADVVVDLGYEQVHLRKQELRARSNYFAAFPEEEFPKRFMYRPCTAENSYLKFESVITPALTADKQDDNLCELDPDILKQAHDSLKAVLGFICPSCPELSTTPQSEEAASVLGICQGLTVYECTKDVKRLFISEFGLDPRKKDPYLVLQIASYFQDKDLFSLAMPHAVGQWFRDTPRASMAYHLEDLVQSEADAFEDLVSQTGEKIELILTETDSLCYAVAAHCIRQKFTIAGRSFVHLEAKQSWALLKRLHHECSGTIITIESSAMQQVAILDGVHESVGSNANQRALKVAGLSASSVRGAVRRLLVRLAVVLDPLFVEDQDMGYFTPAFCGSFPWEDESASDTDTNSRLDCASDKDTSSDSDYASDIDDSAQTYSGEEGNEDASYNIDTGDVGLNVTSETLAQHVLTFRPRVDL